MKGKYEIEDVYDKLVGKLVCSPQMFLKRLSSVNAFIFDWDGVFNSGRKGGNVHSGFSEPDSMGINMLRFAYWLSHNKTLPFIAIVTGEQNPVAQTLTDREHFDALFFRIGNKVEAVNYLDSNFGIKPQQIAFCFDDILDLGMAKMAGLRFLVKRKANPYFEKYVKQHQLCDYITGCSGENHAIREISEVLSMGLSQFERVIDLRCNFDALYVEYLLARDQTKPAYFTQNKGKGIINQPS